jgi:hypothetical protein
LRKRQAYLTTRSVMKCLMRTILWTKIDRGLPEP